MKYKEVPMWNSEIIKVSRQGINDINGLQATNFSPCLAIGIRIQNQYTVVLGLNHWPGSNVSLEEIQTAENDDYSSENEREEELRICYDSIKDEVRREFHNFWDEVKTFAVNQCRMHINKSKLVISIIGGEARTANSRGTEVESRRLLDYATQLQQKHHNLIVQHYFPKYKHEEQTVSVQIDVNSARWRLSTVAQSTPQVSPSRSGRPNFFSNVNPVPSFTRLDLCMRCNSI